ncbi:MAG: hypothetical protein Q8J80_06010 [Gallionella sp.]|nr:hypothetical protein [Gallionella sp.]
MSSQNESRWWEFYGVRYAMGTVVGALIVHFIFSSNDNLRKLLFLPEKMDNFGMAHLALLAAYGLAYCYIASAPILVMHAARSFFWTPQRTWPVTIAIILISFAAGLLTFCKTDSIIQALAATVLAITISFQARYIWILFDQFSTPHAYYKELIENRKRPPMFEFVESYKHLREHGNSFLIVFFEFFLGFILSSFTSETVAGHYIFSRDAVANLFLVLFIWVIPPACIWGFGQKLEQSLVRDKDGGAA